MNWTKVFQFLLTYYRDNDDGGEKQNMPVTPPTSPSEEKQLSLHLEININDKVQVKNLATFLQKALNASGESSIKLEEIEEFDDL